jgi:hypothetical protein
VNGYEKAVSDQPSAISSQLYGIDHHQTGGVMV